MDNLENIVNKSEKIKDGLLAIYPIACLSAASSLIGLTFPSGTLFNLPTSVSVGSSFYLGFSENKYRKIGTFGVLASTYILDIAQYLSGELSENFEQEIGIRIVGAILGYSLGSVLKK